MLRSSKYLAIIILSAIMISSQPISSINQQNNGDISFEPTGIYLNEQSQPAMLLFTSGKDLFATKLDTPILFDIETICTIEKGRLYGVHYARTRNGEVGYLLSVHSYDDYYNPDSYNGIYFYHPASGTLQQIIDDPRIKFVSSFSESNDIFVTYFTDSTAGNIWWIDLIGFDQQKKMSVKYKALAGRIRHDEDSLSFMGGFGYIDGYPEYNQDNKGLGVMSSVTIGNEILFANFELGCLLSFELKDPKTREGQHLSLDYNRFTMYAFSRIRYYNGQIYVAISIERKTKAIFPGNRIVRYGNGKTTDIVNQQIGYIIDFVIYDNSIIVTAVDDNQQYDIKMIKL